MSSSRTQIISAQLGSEAAQRTALMQRSLRKMFEWYCATVFRFYCPLTVVGQERVPAGGFIFCSNHNSHMDSAVLMAASGKGFDHFGMVAARDYFFESSRRGAFLNQFMSLIPIDRKCNRSTLKAYLAAARKFVKAGQKSLIIYPEGTRSTTGNMLPLKKGPAIIAVELGLPLLPAYIDGTNRAWPKGRTLMKPRRIRVSIGEPIYPAQFEDHDRPGRVYNLKVYRRVTQELEGRIHRLRDETAHAKSC